MAVVAALEFQDLRPAREPAGQAHRAHRGLRAGIDHAHLLHAGAVHDQLRQADLRLSRGAEGQAVLQGFFHRLHDLGVSVAVDHRAPGADEIDIGVAVDVDKRRAVRFFDETRLPAHGTEAAHRRIHAAGRDRLRALEQLCRAGGVLGRGGRWLVRIVRSHVVDSRTEPQTCDAPRMELRHTHKRKDDFRFGGIRADNSAYGC